MTPRNPHVLVVDDEPANVDIVRRVLEGAEYRVSSSADGEEAWQQLQDPSFPLVHAILLDRMMPHLDGMGLLARLQADPRLRRIPVIFLTADRNADLVSESIQAGAYYHLTKPFDRALLLSLVEATVKVRTDLLEMEHQLLAASQATGLLEEAAFRFRRPEEARALATLLSQACPDPYSAALGLWELFQNAVEHGNLELTYEDKGRLLKNRELEEELRERLGRSPYQDRWVQVHYRRDAQGHLYTIRDEGPGFDWTRFLELHPDRAFHSHGRGIAMARQLCFQSLDYQGRGNVVVARITV